ncbi:unnamed protein product [Tilletia controversa]|uniref:VWFA domain-containing protein n=3 Tax=Tilletia TaxID=13289 RepID=A0A8X7MRD1_9BASI|nr:hypothetical protein CF336_g5042 [Tilletia laevis]KAE8195055.1 hypothetical protein CF328_g4560 [Tilletia controversa]KAE8258919.1 hypothetical protein A4X03_0g4240 [Tilletia caries]KAE8199266.1 hypothetical protein CF335_g4210 [Tilletia laevis]KAE8245992.1 hypothetical protein A4X06_0g5270 [Tilletia controversa]
MPRRDEDAYVDKAGPENDPDEFDDFLDDDDSGDDYQHRSGPAGRSSRPRRAPGNALASSSRLPSASASNARRAGLRADEAEERKRRDRAKKAAKSGGGGASYRWEATYKRSWDAVHEDESGSLTGTIQNLVDANKRRRTLRNEAPVQRGIIRHLVLILDLSEAMLEKDMRPNRWDLSLQFSREFVNEYFDQNPIGQLAVLATRDGIAERIIPMGGNTMDHVTTLSNKRRFEPRGEPSLQNALEMARSSLSHLPASNSREVLIIFGSLTTSDPGNIHDTMSALKHDNVRVNIVSLAAEMKICKEICTQTGGTFGVALNEGHFRDLLFQLVPPPEVEGKNKAKRKKKKPRLDPTNGDGGAHGDTTEGADDGDDDEEDNENMADLMQMGFPLRLPGSAPMTLCSCHSKLRSTGYLCPRCGAKMCEVPTDCPICGLTIVMSTHLARSYHHLFPVPNFAAKEWSSVVRDSEDACFSCAIPFPSKPRSQARSQAPANGASSTSTSQARPSGARAQAKDKGKEQQPAVLAESGRYACERCGNDFCLDCDAFIHEHLHLCPGCGE